MVYLYQLDGRYKISGNIKTVFLWKIRAIFKKRHKSAISAFLNSEGFLVLYSAFVLIFSFLGNNAVTLSVILLTLAVIFFTQKNLRPIFVPLTLSYFALTFIDGEFKLNWLFYLSATVFVVSLVYYIVANRPKLFLTTNLKALLPYGAAYVLAGSFAANYMQNKIYHQQIALLLLVVAAFLLLSLIAANSEFDGPEFVFKVIFALGSGCRTAMLHNGARNGRFFGRSLSERSFPHQLGRV